MSFLLHHHAQPKEMHMPPTSNSFTLTSPVFEGGGTIPTTYTCKGQNISPPLTISGAPSGTVSLVLIVHDPNAPGGDFLHWAMWNLPANTASIDENSVPPGAVQGRSDFGKTGYGGPCPPSGTHHYEFNLYALDAMLPLQEGADRQALEQAMQGHIIAQAKLVGTVSAVN